MKKVNIFIMLILLLVSAFILGDQKANLIAVLTINSDLVKLLLPFILVFIAIYFWTQQTEEQITKPKRFLEFSGLLLVILIFILQNAWQLKLENQKISLETTNKKDLVLFTNKYNCKIADSIIADYTKSVYYITEIYPANIDLITREFGGDNRERILEAFALMKRSQDLLRNPPQPSELIGAAKQIKYDLKIASTERSGICD